MTSGVTDGDLIEDYLDRLFVSVSGSPRQARHTLAEVEAHLRDAVADGVASGLSEREAQAQAIERIGPVQAVTGRPAALARPSRALLRRVTLTAALVGGAGLLAIGFAALLGSIFDAIKGDKFLTAPWPPGVYTQADCARWLAGDHATHSCVTAMLDDHTTEILGNASLCGILGVIVLAVYVMLRRRWQDRATRTALPAGTAQVLGGGLAALVAVACYGQVVDIETVQHGIGAGTPLSLGIAATMAAAGFGLAFGYLVRRRRSTSLRV
jgi:hypothetical protein